MRRVKIFSGSSHPVLVGSICERLGTSPAACDLSKFSNGETSVSINTSIRDQDVFIVQSGSSKINDSVMELLIMISACKGGSAKSITAVMPYFPYSRQSKKKSHRGAITARLIANLLSVAGINHVMTVDLHAPPSQGFFGKPVDNLHAEPLIARWIKQNVLGWRDAVVVSKNPGGTKRVTSLADVLKLNFALVTTDSRRNVGSSLRGSMILGTTGSITTLPNGDTNGHSEDHTRTRHDSTVTATQDSPRHHINGVTSHPRQLQHQELPNDIDQGQRPAVDRYLSNDSTAEEYTDERAQEVVSARLVHGHVVDDDFPSPSLSTISSSAHLPGELSLGLYRQNTDSSQDPMASSIISNLSAYGTGDQPLGGSVAESDEEDHQMMNPEMEHTITLVGKVKDHTVFIIDDMIDGAASWIAAAETVVMRGGAKSVYCIATHGLFGDDSLEQMQACKCIDKIVVTNSYPIETERIEKAKKLVILDISGLLSEAIRRNHYGESISQLFQHFPD